MDQQTTLRIIYHADDDEDDRLLFIDAMGELGLSVTVHQAADGQALLDLLFHAPQGLPEIVFLDINMPRRNGFDCLSELRRQGGPLGAVKVVMLSTSGSMENIARSFELGADLYAVKPSSYQGLKELLSGILGAGQQAVKKNKNSHKVYSSLTWML